MAEYDNTNKGVLYENSRKSHPSQPDRTGEIQPLCPHCGATTTYWLSAWWKNTRVGEILSLAMNPKEPAAPEVSPAPVVTPSNTNTNPSPMDDFDDDIPF